MLCGQSGAGKSTFGKFLYKNLKNVIFIRIDDISPDLDPFQRYEKYISNISNALNSINDLVILDHHHSIKWMRKEILNSINSIYYKNIDLIVIIIRPDIDTILSHKIKFTEKQKQQVINNYNSFELPTEEEFSHYDFNSIKIISFNGNKNFYETILEEIK